jgi:hypothetical protein
MKISKEISERTGLTVDQLAAFLQECQRDGVPGDTVLRGGLSGRRKVLQVGVSFEREPKPVAAAGKRARSDRGGSDGEGRPPTLALR